MGKGRIITAHGGGRYTLEILEDRARAESSRAMAVQRVAELDQRIVEMEDDVVHLQAHVEALADDQDQAIALHQQQLADDGESDVDLAAYAVAVMEAAANRDRKRIEIGQMQADRLALQTRIERIDALPPLRQVEAWCADYTEDLSGDVATAEVPGEIGQVIIKPGFDGNTWSAAADGVIQPAISGTPAGVFYNLAMLPGWQKWRPTFRIATISNIVNDTCDIALIPAASSQQGLNVNMASAYDGVPIMYMDCNGDAFEEGDRVLVAFSGNTSNPVVVGFEQEPIPCVSAIFHLTQLPAFPPNSQELFAVGSDARFQLGTYSTGVEDCFGYHAKPFDVNERTLQASWHWQPVANPFGILRYTSHQAQHSSSASWEVVSGSAGAVDYSSAEFQFSADRDSSSSSFDGEATGWFTTGLSSGTSSCPSGPDIDAYVTANASTNGYFELTSSSTVRGISINWQRTFRDITQATVTDEVKGWQSGPAGITIVGLTLVRTSTTNKMPVITASDIIESLNLCGVSVDMAQVCAHIQVDNTMFPGSETDAWRSSQPEYSFGAFAPELVLELRGSKTTLSFAICYRRRTGGLKGFVISIETQSAGKEWARVEVPNHHRSTLASKSEIGFTFDSLTPLPADVG